MPFPELTTTTSTRALDVIDVELRMAGVQETIRYNDPHGPWLLFGIVTLANLIIVFSRKKNGYDITAFSPEGALPNAFQQSLRNSLDEFQIVWLMGGSDSSLRRIFQTSATEPETLEHVVRAVCRREESKTAPASPEAMSRIFAELART